LDDLTRSVISELMRVSPSDLAASIRQTLESIEFVRWSDDGKEVYTLQGNRDAPKWPHDPIEARIGVVKGQTSLGLVEAHIWVTKGKIGVVEYSRDVRSIRRETLSSPTARPAKWPFKSNAEVSDSDQDPTLPAWLKETLGNHIEIELFSPVSVERFRGDVPPDVRDLWKATDGFISGSLEISGVGDVATLTIDMVDLLQIGTLETDPIVYSKRRGFELLGSPERVQLGHSLQAAVKALVALR
jgi:hypothetical protein